MLRNNCQEILQQGLQELNLPYDDAKIESLLAFIKLIEKWNKTYNLTAIRDPEEMATLHILDSLAVLPYLEGKRVADIGTGAGLPGIPLAIFLPETSFSLLDSNAKKTRFVKQAMLELKLTNVTDIHSRVEEFKPPTLFSTVIMRAFAELEKILLLSHHLLDKNAILLAMKGQNPEQELKNISATCNIIPIVVPGIQAERCLIRIKRQNNG